MYLGSEFILFQQGSIMVTLGGTALGTGDTTINKREKTAALGITFLWMDETEGFPSSLAVFAGTLVNCFHEPMSDLDAAKLGCKTQCCNHSSLSSLRQELCLVHKDMSLTQHRALIDSLWWLLKNYLLNDRLLCT